MKRKTKADLQKEIEQLQRRIAELEAQGSGSSPAERDADQGRRNVAADVLELLNKSIDENGEQALPVRK